ncbi:MAG: alanine dehydrogenase [Bacteroidetes bacterium]|uniref:alanine dehydrogenase n=1 Tax=Phaeocystidibacter marisrubri TaxID=1577780 RepID=A0A6L3ZE53_9FLAO|nr:alanine dehydrogenase [Phaeocystidibacter marisrubri]KAB2815950.1 alanine dehydrogenase [Phaeocystidibacter marisrubri]TNE31347.1 MAG: alanine dehydrogenase [Bacteroidota bacterium]GGH66546.1 alanine dehydrogenase [Phaeocystidibacter marisrubri]
MTEPNYFSFSSTQLVPQEERLAVSRKKGKLQIGVPRETCMQENRVALTPEGVHLLVSNGHEVLVETKAGEGARYTDRDFSEAGATIAYTPKEVFECDVVLKVEPPSMEELDLMKQKQTLISALQLKTCTREYFKKLMAKRVTAISYENIRDEEGQIPIVRHMSEIAGNASILIAAEYLSNVNNGKGYIMGGVTGVPPTDVVIIGAGTVGTYAARTATGMGASVKVFDKSLSRLKRLQAEMPIPIYTCVTQPKILEKALRRCDVAIGAIRSEGGRTPCIVTEEMVRNMKPGSVIVDVSIDQGGCFETSELTSHDDPVVVKHGVIHYGVPNIASRVSRTASFSLSNIFAQLLLSFGEEGGVEDSLRFRKEIRAGMYIYNGVLVNKAIGEWFDLPYSDGNLLFG